MRLIVFARAPVAGVAKTRLAPALGAHGASRLHARLVEHTVDKALAAAAAVRASDAHSGPAVELHCAPDCEHQFFAALAARAPLRLVPQSGDDLGERMCRALRGPDRESHAPAILFGCDCPGMCPADLQQAARWLQEGNDAVIGPACDGGYYLIGCRRPAHRLFDGLRWGTDSVLDTTRVRLRELAWRWRELPVYPDVDRPEDLVHLPAELHPTA